VREATGLCLTALALAPDSSDTWCQRGTLHLHAGVLDEAEGALRRAVELDPRSVKSLVRLGQTLLARGDHPGAVAALDQAIALDPGHVLARVYRAQARGLDSAAAWDDLERATELAPGLAEGWEARAEANLKRERWSE